MGTPTNAAIVDLNGRKWNPFESKTPTGHVTYTEGEGDIHIPYGTDPVSLTIQAHELAHVRYTAKVWKNIESCLTRLTGLAKTTNAIVGYAEDMRITALAGRLGVKTLPRFGNAFDQPIIDGWVNSFIAASLPADRVHKAVNFILNEHTTVLERLGLSLDTLQKPANAEAYIVHCAQHIHALLERDEDTSKTSGKSADSKDKGSGKGKGEKGKTSETPSKSDEKSDEKTSADDSGDEQDGDEDAGDESESEESECDESESAPSKSEGGDSTTPSKATRSHIIDLTYKALPDIREAMVASVPAPEDTAKLVQTFQHTLDTADWIPVTTIDRMPLVRRAAQSRNRGRKLSETGVVLGSAYDAVAPNERRPFTAKRKGGAGGLVVLIDCSGSMHISEAQLDKLLLAHPQGVVVTYSSYVSPDKAVVRVIASHGRVAAVDKFRDVYAGGNGCDGPMLEWLAKQSGERVWVCDGHITGKGDSGVSYSHPARDAWLKAHRITRYPSLRAYLDSLT